MSFCSIQPVHLRRERPGPGRLRLLRDDPHLLPSPVWVQDSKVDVPQRAPAVNLAALRAAAAPEALATVLERRGACKKLKLKARTVHEKCHALVHTGP